MNRFIYVIKILLIERMHFTRLRLSPHCIFCWTSHNPILPVISTHPSTQWAAVTTQLELMIEPPHLWLPKTQTTPENIINEKFYWKKQHLLGRWTINRLRNLELRKFFLDVKNHSFTWHGKSSIFTGRPPTIRPSRRGRWRVVTAPEKTVDFWPNLRRHLLLH